MSAHFEKLNQYIKQFVHMTDAELLLLNEQCHKVYFNKGDIIMKAGERQKSLFFITKGIIRNYVENIKGNIKIYNFRSELMTVTGYALYNYEDHLKALVNVECLVDCVMIEVPLKAIDYVIKNMESGERLGRFMAEMHVIEMLKSVIQRDTKTIIERYNDLEAAFPNIHNRIPQHMIASYLGITPVHLSNLKKNRKILTESI
jgi:CRP-like cAMP-binding protein